MQSCRRDRRPFHPRKDFHATPLSRRALALGLAAAAALPSLSFAQAYPAKPITVVVAFSAGGNNDLRARQLGIPVGAMLGQSVIVDNKPGASGNIGHDYVAKAAPDGYTLGIGAMGPLAVNPSLYPKLNFDPQKDFTPIVLIEKAPLVLVTRVEKPFKSVKDVVDAAKAKPGALTIGNAGPGGAHHLSGELFEQAAGITTLSVPYKGGGPASTALLSGEIDMMFEQTYAALPSIKAGKTRALAVTSAKAPAQPARRAHDGRTGLPGSGGVELAGPDRPQGHARGRRRPAERILQQGAGHARHAREDHRPRQRGRRRNPEEFAAFIAAENKRWAALVKAKGIKLD
jgi:tripartite-type tricarboxylate transporter receptor subunit TctC